MKKLTALLLALLVCLTVTACGGDVAVDGSESDASVSAAATTITDEQIKTLTEAYNQIAPLYNEVYVAAEKNGWLNDEQTAAEINAVGSTMGVIGTALTEDISMLEGADVDELATLILQFIPELETMAKKVAVPFAQG